MESDCMLVCAYQKCVFCKQKTAYEKRISDWSSDVCSSDLGLTLFGAVSPLNAATGTLPLDTRCEATSARVHVAGFKDRTGNLRIQAYGGNPSEFLENGKKLVRVEGEVSQGGEMGG